MEIMKSLKVIAARKKYRNIEGTTFQRVGVEKCKEIRANLVNRVNEWINEQSQTTFKEAIAGGARFDFEIKENNAYFISKIFLVWSC